MVYKEILHITYLYSGCGDVTAGKAAAGWDARFSTEWAACSFSSGNHRGQARWDRPPRLALAQCVQGCHDNAANLF